LHAINHAALRDENIISQLHSLLLKQTLGACAGRFILMSVKPAAQFEVI
jgi:hypothetical protein